MYVIWYFMCYYSYRIHIELERTRDMSAMSSRDMYNRQPSPQMERLADKKIINGKVDRQTNQSDQLMPNLLAEYILQTSLLVIYIIFYSKVSVDWISLDSVY